MSQCTLVERLSWLPSSLHSLFGLYDSSWQADSQNLIPETHTVGFWAIERKILIPKNRTSFLRLSKPQFVQGKSDSETTQNPYSKTCLYVLIPNILFLKPILSWVMAIYCKENPDSETIHIWCASIFWFQTSYSWNPYCFELLAIQCKENPDSETTQNPYHMMCLGVLISNILFLEPILFWVIGYSV